MLELHDHLPTPDDIRTIVYVSEDGRLMRVNPEQYPRVLCLLPECRLNSRNVQSQEGDGSSSADRPAGALPVSPPRAGDRQPGSASGTHVMFIKFLSLLIVLPLPLPPAPEIHLTSSPSQSSLSAIWKAALPSALSPRAAWYTTSGESWLTPTKIPHPRSWTLEGCLG